MPLPKTPPTADQWTHIFAMFEDGKGAVKRAHEWLQTAARSDMSYRTFCKLLRIERETRRLDREAAAKRPRLADLAAGADGSCTERMTGLASESPSTLSVTPNIEAAATNRPAAGDKEPCEACAKARDVLRATACYHVFDAAGRGEVLCPACYAAREAALAATGGCKRVTRLNSAGQPMLSLTRGPAVATAADQAEFRELRARVAAAA